VKPSGLAASPSVSAEPAALVTWVLQVLAVAQAELHKLRRDPTEILTRAIQPALWLVVFGEVLGRSRAIPTGALSYREFLTPGVLAQSVLFTAIFYGIAIIWERDLGILQKVLISPAYRSALVVGKALTAAVRGLVQSVVIYGLAALLGIRLNLSPPAVGGVILLVALGAAIFATFSLVVACIVKTRERFMGIGQVLTMPMFFLSNAIYPLNLMPSWMAGLARLNPLSYLVDGLRRVMIAGGQTGFGLGTDFLALLAIFMVLVGLAARLYPTVVR
jgi:ABC-2 type transport system permease protein